METISNLISVPFKVFGTISRAFIYVVTLILLTGFVTVAVTKGANLAGSSNSPPAAPSYPVQESRYVNDLAGLLSTQDKARLRDRLADAEAQSGLEATVLTVDDYRSYGTGEDSVEAFARNLFETWGIGGASGNGVLILVSVREGGHGDVRLQLGRPFGHDYDQAMQRVIDKEMLPHFRAQRYSQGIQAGTEATLDALIDSSAEPSLLDRLRDLFAAGGRGLRAAVIGILVLLSVVGWFRYRFLSGGLLRNLASLGLFVAGGAFVGLFVGSAIGAIEVDLSTNVNALQTTLGRFFDTFTSGRILSSLADFDRATLVGVASGALSGGVLWFSVGDSPHRRHRYGGGSGGGSGGGASGSW